MKRSLLKSIFLIHLYSRFPGTADCISSMMILRLSLGILSLILRRSFGVKTDQNMALQKCISFAFRFQNNLWYLNISTSLNCFIRSFSAFISYFLEASIRFLTLFFVCLFALFFFPNSSSLLCCLNNYSLWMSYNCKILIEICDIIKTHT